MSLSAAWDKLTERFAEKNNYDDEALEKLIFSMQIEIDDVEHDLETFREAYESRPKRGYR